MHHQSFAVTKADRSLSVSRYVGGESPADLLRYCELHNLAALRLFCVLTDKNREEKLMRFPELISFFFLFLLNFPELTGYFHILWG